MLVLIEFASLVPACHSPEFAKKFEATKSTFVNFVSRAVGIFVAVIGFFRWSIAAKHQRISRCAWGHSSRRKRGEYRSGYGRASSSRDTKLR